MASSGPEVEAFVMGHPKGDAQEGHEGQLGACPFSHRVLFTLEEKGVPYSVTFVDVKNKPAWVSKVNPAGKLPIIKDLALDHFVVDSDTIVDYLEEKYAQEEEAEHRRRLGKTADMPHPGEQMMPKLMAFLKAQGEGGAEREELRQQLKAVNDVLSNEHPYCGGTEPNAWDLALAPRVYIARVGCQELKGWDFAVEEFPDVRDWLHRMTGRHAWRNTASWNDESIAAELRAKAAA